MAEQTTPVRSGSDHPLSPEIPWMQFWEKKPERERTADEEDRTTRLVRIDYVTMLEELEFR